MDWHDWVGIGMLFIAFVIFTVVWLAYYEAADTTNCYNFVLDLLDTIENLERQRNAAASDMLRLVRGSLEMYPDGGGDIEIMKTVDKIRDTAHAAAIQAACEAIEKCSKPYPAIVLSQRLIRALTPADAQRLYDLRIAEAVEAAVNECKAWHEDDLEDGKSNVLHIREHCYECRKYAERLADASAEVERLS